MTVLNQGRESTRVTFTNPNPRPGTFTIVYDDSACCGSNRADDTLSILASATRTVDIAPCTSACLSTSISVYDGAGDVCPGAQAVPVAFPTLATLATGASPPDGETTRRIASAVRLSVFTGEYESSVNQARFNGEVVSMLANLISDLRIPSGSHGDEYLGNLGRLAELASAAADRAGNNTIQENSTSTGLFNESEQRAAQRFEETRLLMDLLRQNFTALRAQAIERNENNSAIAEILPAITANASRLTATLYQLDLAIASNMTEFMRLAVVAFRDIRQAAIDRNFDFDAFGSLGLGGIVDALASVPGFIVDLAGEVLQAVKDAIPELPSFGGIALATITIVTLCMSGAALVGVMGLAWKVKNMDSGVKFVSLNGQR